jgi:hypothetical protein
MATTTDSLRETVPEIAEAICSSTTMISLNGESVVRVVLFLADDVEFNRGDAPLLPADVNLLQAHFLAQSDFMAGLELWLFTLLSIRLALREHECDSMRLDSFDDKLCRVQDSGLVDYLAVSIHVKRFSLFLRVIDRQAVAGPP